MSRERSISRPESSLRRQLAIWSELTKLRLTSMVLITTAMGFYLAPSSTFNWMLLFHALFGTALLASAAAALNQYAEREYDARMPRTSKRPIPSGEISPRKAVLFGGVVAILGIIYLANTVNFITSLIGAITLISYIDVYTPLKRVTSLNTLIGAIPGALPPLMGWTAATGSQGVLAAEAWSLVAILFFWQLPHFLSIAWIYRDDYANAGFEMISKGEKGAANTGQSALLYCFALIPSAISPYLLGISGTLYFCGALLLSVYFLFLSFKFSREMKLESARSLFYYSLLYLPLLLGLMIWDRTI